ncbi:MAG: hypothetical protein F6K49_51095 [Moorea sp. SIO3I6]|nr:hypothetical protein [Moorena sp. SIO3I6]
MEITTNYVVPGNPHSCDGWGGSISNTFCLLLLPTPYSLLPTPYSLFPIPYSLCSLNQRFFQWEVGSSKEFCCSRRRWCKMSEAESDKFGSR